jgi:PAS domain S-box-containing protein
MNETADKPSIPRGAIATLGIFVVACLFLGWIVGDDLPELHTILDTAMFVLSAILALLLWDMGERLERPFKKHLAITFAAVAVLELLHAVASVEWSGPLAWVSATGRDVRPLTWPPPAFVLPIGIGMSLWCLRQDIRTLRWFALLMCGVAIGLFVLFRDVPPYSAPTFLGITRPSLIAVPLMWGAVIWGCWRLRDADRALPTLALMGGAILLGSLVMLYSRFPPDTMAILAHLGRVSGNLALLFSIMHMASLDMVERIRAEGRLARLNEQLDARVQEQTAELRTTNKQLGAEIAERRKSHEILKAITENTPAVIYVKDLQGRYLMINPRFAEIFRIDAAATVGKTDYDLFDKKAADAFRAMDERVVLADRALTEQEQAPQHDGVHHYISVKAPLRDEHGRPYAVFGISTNITDLKRTQERLAESEERARLIVETALDAVIGMDSKGVLVNWSPRAVTTFGWSRDEALGRKLADLIIPERYRVSHEAGLARYLASGEARVLNQRIEILGLHRDGHEFPVELSITAIQSGGEVTFSGFVRDITGPKEAQAKMRAQMERMGLLDKITRAIGERQDLDSIFQVVVRTLEDQLPVDFVCLCLYDRVDQSLTVSRVGAKSGALALELAMPERSRVGIDENGLSRCVRGQLVYEADISDVAFPFPKRLARGGLRSLVIAPLQIESDVFGVLVVARREANAFTSGECEFLRQLSEHVALAAHQAQLHSALQQAYDDLRQTQQAFMQQERLRAIGQMASGIAHDINNALSPAALYTQILLETEEDLSPKAREYLAITQRAIEDVGDTVARLRDFYRSREPQLTLSPVDLNQVVRQVIDLTRARWTDMPMQKGIVIDVNTELEAGVPAIMAVESEMREALTNLLLNAVDAVPDGGVVTLRTKAKPPTLAGGLSHVEVEVTDNGVGMDEDTRRRCLEPFFTTKGERGTGLGLAMVYGVVQRHSAEIDIVSKPGAGTTVRMTFIAPAANSDDSARIAAGQDVGPLATRLRLLIVDDDPLLLQAVRTILETDGHAVTAANGGAAGIAAFRSAKERSEPFAIVITDLGMPYIDGRKVAAAVKGASPSTPVILLTGWGQQLVGGDVPPHVDLVLSKPPKLREVRAALAQFASPRT